MANMRTKDINFYTHFADPTKKTDPSKLICLSVCGVIVLAIAGTYAFLFMQTTESTQQVSDLQSQVSDPTLLDKIKNSAQMESDANRMDQIVTAMQANDATIEKQSKLKDEITGALLMRIIECENEVVSVDSFSYADGTVTLTLTSDTENEAANYVTRLRETGAFAWVDYTGFASSNENSSSGDSEKTGTQYGYTITAVFDTESETESGGTQ